MKEFCYNSGEKGFFSMTQNPKAIKKFLNLTTKRKMFNIFAWLKKNQENQMTNIDLEKDLQH